MKLAMQELGRQLGSYIHKKKRVMQEGQKRDYIKTYIPHLAEALQEIVGFKKEDEKKVEEALAEILEQHRGELEEIEVENTEYDESFAKIGSGKDEEGGEDDAQ